MQSPELDVIFTLCPQLEPSEPVQPPPVILYTTILVLIQPPHVIFLSRNAEGKRNGELEYTLNAAMKHEQ